MSKYKIVKVRTNLNRTYYKIRTKWLGIFWMDVCYEDSDDPIEYSSIEKAEEDIESWIEFDRDKNEHEVATVTVKTY